MSGYLSELPDTDELRRKSGKMLLARISGSDDSIRESLVEVKNLDEALKILKTDYDLIIQKVESELDDLKKSSTSEEYEAEKGLYYLVTGSTLSNNHSYRYAIRVEQSSIESDEYIIYKFYNFKETKYMFEDKAAKIVQVKKIRLK
jgi:hypothetical protein